MDKAISYQGHSQPDIYLTCLLTDITANGNTDRTHDEKLAKYVNLWVELSLTGSGRLEAFHGHSAHKCCIWRNRSPQTLRK